MKLYRIPQLAPKYTDYPMIQAHTTLPQLAHFRLQLIYEMLDKFSPYDRDSELFTLATALVQLGMDTHDQIDVSLEPCSEQEMRTRQIRVLSGDYFSARFYQLLANAGQIDMITALSQGVCEVNQLKIDLYLRMKQNKVKTAEYMEQMVKIRSELFVFYGKLLELDTSSSWLDLLHNVTKCEWLLEEIERSQSSYSFHHSLAYWFIWHQGSELEQQKLHSLGGSSWSEELMLKYKVPILLQKELGKAVDAYKTAASAIGVNGLLNELTANIVHAAAAANHYSNESALK